MTLQSAIYEGWVRHRRTAPKSHDFRYSMFMMCLDLSELNHVFRGRWLWSSRGPALAWFRRGDHLGDPDRPLDDAVRDLVESRLGRRPSGSIRLVTHLRYFGYCMNPVSFYYCNDEAGGLDAIVAEVHNTPWNERHCYVLDAAGARRDGSTYAFGFSKVFHVSPFMSMDQSYEWRFTSLGDELVVHMENLERRERLFDATMVMQRQPITAGQLRRVLIRYPFMTGRVIAGIYWQALRLRLKGCPFYSHPSRATPEARLP